MMSLMPRSLIMSKLLHSSRRPFLLTALACALASIAFAKDGGGSIVGNELAEYLAQPDENFGWREVTSGRIGNVEYVEYLMTSQTWRDIEWKHQFFMLRP